MCNQCGEEPAAYCEDCVADMIAEARAIQMDEMTTMMQDTVVDPLVESGDDVMGRTLARPVHRSEDV